MESSADRIYRELTSEDSSIWYIADEYGSKIMIKLPSTAIKAIVKGCKVQFLFGKDKNYFHIGLRVYDDEINCLIVTGMNRFWEEHTSMMKIFSTESTAVEFYNELDACFIKSSISFTSEARSIIIDMIGDVTELYVGDLDKEGSASLDSFNFYLDSEGRTDNAYEMESFVAEGEFSEFIVMQNYFVGVGDVHKIEIDNKNEGELLERLVWASLISLFAGTLFKNPLTNVANNGRRELIDIIAFYENGIFLIESKSLSVSSLEKEKSMDRKIAGVQKQIRKGINQLVGASKVLHRNEDIYDAKCNEIILDRNIVPHCVVLVSDLFPIGEWDQIELVIFNTMIKDNVLLNIMDLKEFLKYVKVSGGNAKLFDYNLIKRAELFMKTNNIHIESRLK